MRVLIAGNVGESLPPPYAGIPKRALLLAKELRENRHECALVFEYHHDKEDDLGAEGTYYFNYETKPSRAQKALTILRRAGAHPVLFMRLVVDYYRAHRKLPNEAYVSASFGLLIDQILHEWKPDVILCESALARSFFTLKIAARRRVPTVVDTYAEVHDAGILKLSGGETHRKKYWEEVLGMPHTIVAPSFYCAAGPQEFARDKVRVIYAGIEFDKYVEQSMDKREARAHFGIPEDAFCAVAVGALSPRKGHDHLIESISRKGNERVLALICGPGDSTWLKNLAVKLGVSERVRFFSDLSERDLISLYRASDVYVDASNTPRACLGMSVTEAMAVGMPIIAYRVGGLPEVVRENENGYLVPLDDIDELASTLARVTSLPEQEHKTYAEKGRKLARELVDVKKTSERMMQVLEEATLQRGSIVL